VRSDRAAFTGRDESLRWIHFITGDPAFAGIPEEYASPSNSLFRLVERNRRSSGAVFVVPGNYADIDRRTRNGCARWSSDEDAA
jgi:hypothetical protein